MANKTSMKGFPDPSLTLRPLPASQLDLTGRKLVVVGGTDGLGRAIAKLAAARGARVTVVGRTFRDEGVPGISFVKADLSSLKAAAALGAQLPVEDADVLLFTAGIMAAKTREVTAEGVERDMAVSYLNRLTMLRGLASRLGATLPQGVAPRLFVMGFPGAGQLGDVDDMNGERAYDAFKVHMNTVAGNEAIVLDGAQRWPRLRVHGLNPGLVKTGIRANYLGDGSVMHRIVELLIGLFTTSADGYATRILPAMFAPELGERTGVILGAKGQPILPTDGMTPEHVQRLLSASDALITRALAA